MFFFLCTSLSLIQPQSGPFTVKVCLTQKRIRVLSDTDPLERGHGLGALLSDVFRGTFKQTSQWNRGTSTPGERRRQSRVSFFVCTRVRLSVCMTVSVCVCVRVCV